MRNPCTRRTTRDASEVHWTRRPVHESHVMAGDRCVACYMHRDWEGSRDTCRLRALSKRLKANEAQERRNSKC